MADGCYVEGDARLTERQEAHSLRVALEDVDAEEEQRLHEAAQDEASRLVWEHANPGAAKKVDPAYRNPDATGNDWRSQLGKSRHARSQSQEAQDVQRIGPPPGRTMPEPRKTKSYYGLANAVSKDVELSKRRVSSGSKRKASSERNCAVR